MSFSNELEKAFNENSNTENAVAMSKYMKNNFQFFGIKTDERRHILKTIWKENQKEVSDKRKRNCTRYYIQKKNGNFIIVLLKF